VNRCPVTVGRPARVPRRTARVNSVRCRILDSLGSTSGHPEVAAKHENAARPPHQRAPRSARKQAPCKRSGAEARAPLVASCRENGTASAGAHAQPETVGLRPAAVVRLERALAHRKLQMRWIILTSHHAALRRRAVPATVGIGLCTLSAHKPAVKLAAHSRFYATRRCLPFAGGTYWKTAVHRAHNGTTA
jgi:hypothetical protein